MNIWIIASIVLGVVALVGGAVVVYRRAHADSTSQRSKQVDLSGLADRLPPGRIMFVGIVGGLLVLGLGYLTFTFFPLMMAVKMWGVLLLGIAFLPATAYVLGRSLGPIGGMLGKLYVIMGLLPFDRPVLYLNEDDEQVIVEEADLDDDVEIDWYRFAKSWLGFAYPNDEENWPGIDTTMGTKKVGELGEAIADGGEGNAMATLPPGYVPTGQISYAGHDGVVPKRPKDENVHIQTHHTLSWYKDVGRGELLMKAYSYAKEKYGHGSPPVDERWVMALSLVMAVFAAGFGWWMFF